MHIWKYSSYPNIFAHTHTLEMSFPVPHMLVHNLKTRALGFRERKGSMCQKSLYLH